jgi:hypothetical protein
MKFKLKNIKAAAVSVYKNAKFSLQSKYQFLKTKFFEEAGYRSLL